MIKVTVNEIPTRENGWLKDQTIICFEDKTFYFTVKSEEIEFIKFDIFLREKFPLYIFKPSNHWLEELIVDMIEHDDFDVVLNESMVWL